MKFHYFIFLLFLIVSIIPVNGLELTDNNYSSTISYSNNTHDLSGYYLNDTDTFESFKINIRLESFPDSYVFILKDVNNRTLLLKMDFDIDEGFFRDIIIVGVSGRFENNNLEIGEISSRISLKEDYNFEFYKYQNYTRLFSKSIDIDVYEHTLWYNNKFDSKYRVMGIRRNLDSGLITKFTNKKDSYKINYINVYNKNPDNVYNEVYVTYLNDIKNANQDSLNGCVSGLNPVFKLLYYIFSILITVLNTVTFGLLIDDATIYSYKVYICTPLFYLDYLIGLFFSIVSFIWLIGIVYFTAFIEVLILIWSLITTNEIFSGFTKFIDISYRFWNNILIKPLIWIYENFIIKIISLLSK